MADPGTHAAGCNVPLKHGDKIMAPAVAARGIALIEGCGVREGLGGTMGRRLAAEGTIAGRRLQRRSNKKSSKVLSGGWLMSKELFASLDLSPEVRTRTGDINPSWPLLVGLRSASAIFKTKDFTLFYVHQGAMGSSSGSGGSQCGSGRSRALTPGPWRDDVNASRSLRSGGEAGPNEGLALFPFEGDISNRDTGESFLQKLCALSGSFSYVIVGTCDVEVSDRVRRFVADASPRLAAQFRTSLRGQRRGSIIVLTASRCSASRHETGLGLLRQAQGLFRSSAAVSSSAGTASEWSRAARFVYYSSAEWHLHASRSAVDLLGARIRGEPCAVIVPSLAVSSECTRNGTKGSRLDISPGNRCKGQVESSSLPCHIDPAAPSPRPATFPATSLHPTCSPQPRPSRHPVLHPSPQPHALNAATTLKPTAFPRPLASEKPTRLPTDFTVFDAGTTTDDLTGEVMISGGSPRQEAHLLPSWLSPMMVVQLAGFVYLVCAMAGVLWKWCKACRRQAPLRHFTHSNVQRGKKVFESDGSGTGSSHHRSRDKKSVPRDTMYAVRPSHGAGGDSDDSAEGGDQINASFSGLYATDPRKIP